MAWPPVTHQDVQDDLTNGHGWASSLSERFGLGELLLPTPFMWVAGAYYSSAANALVATQFAAVASRLYLTPLYFPTSLSVDRIAVNVSTAGTAGHVARLGIYNAATTTGLPTTVKLDAGTVPVDTTGAKTLTITMSLTGLLWLAMTAQSGTFTAHQSGGSAAIGGSSSTSTAVSNMLIRDSTAPGSALPNLTGDATVAASQGLVPRVVVRAA